MKENRCLNNITADTQAVATLFLFDHAAYCIWQISHSQAVLYVSQMILTILHLKWLNCLYYVVDDI